MTSKSFWDGTKGEKKAASADSEAIYSKMEASSPNNNSMNLNCVKEASSVLPASFSLHSVDLLPVHNEANLPNFSCLTLRNVSNGFLYDSNFRSKSEIRVVHGNAEVRKCVRHVLNPDVKVEVEQEGGCGIWTQPFRIPIIETKTTIQGMCWILETLIQSGWEISTSCVTTVTPGFDVGSYFLKKSSSPPLHNAQVAAVVIDEINGKVEVLSHRRGEKHVDINNAVHRAVLKTQLLSATPSRTATPSSRCSTNLAKEIEAELKLSEKVEAGSEAKVPIKKFAKPMFNKSARDDPKCPSEFAFPTLRASEENVEQKVRDKVQCSRLILEIAHLLFCRQWKLICHSSLPLQNSANSNNIEVLYFCRDGRILPALGQQSFAMIDLEQSNTMRLFNIDESVRDVLKTTVIRIQPHLEQISDAPDYTEFRWTNPVWNHEPDPNERKEATWIKEALAMATIGHIMIAMNKNELNLYGVSKLAEYGRKRCQLLFRQSNIAYSQFLCIHLSGNNKVILIGGGQNEVDLARTVLMTRWPYPVSRDEELILDDKNKAWLFKLKRQPWAMSYGNKSIDIFMDLAQTMVHKPFSSPKNTDADSGKSIVIFLLKALGDHGWRVQMSTDIASTRKSRGQTTHPYSIFLMK